VLADDWQPWSDCDTRCGYGVQSRIREVLVQPLNGGQECGETIQRRLCEGTQCKLPRSHRGAVSQLKGIYANASDYNCPARAKRTLFLAKSARTLAHFIM